jgi:ABC-type transporter Mla MlaB component
MRDDVLTITTEQHDAAATVYVSGTLSVASAVRLVRVCESLPAHIRSARVDLRGVHASDDGAFTVLEARLRDWRRGRGRLHLTLPAATAPHGAFRTSTR